jgi:hypothetical protein
VPLASLLARGYHYLANQGAVVLAGLAVGLRIGQRFRKADHLGAVMLSDIRMHIQRRIGRSLGKPALDLGFLLRQFGHPRLHGWLIPWHP